MTYLNVTSPPIHVSTSYLIVTPPLTLSHLHLHRTIISAALLSQICNKKHLGQMQRKMQHLSEVFLMIRKRIINIPHSAISHHTRYGFHTLVQAYSILTAALHPSCYHQSYCLYELYPNDSVPQTPVLDCALQALFL